MKLAIIRTHNSRINIKSYNVQEIGLAKALLNQNISVDIYSRFYDIYQEFILESRNNYNLKLIPIRGIVLFQRISYYPRLIKLLIAKEYDIIQVHEDSQLMTPLILKACKKKGIKTILYQGMYTKFSGLASMLQLGFDLIFKRITIKNADITFAKTEMARSYLLKKGHKNVKILPVGLNLFKDINVCSEQLNIQNFVKKHKKTLLYIGKIEKRRNPLFLVNILFEIRKSQNIGMVIIGEGPLLSEMIRYSKKQRIYEQFLFLPSLPNNEIDEVYKLCDLFLLPTNNEIYGMVIMEALLNGLPVISTPEAGPLSILTNKKFGSCLRLDEKQWTEAILNYLSKSKTKQDLKDRQEYIIRYFNWEVISKKYLNYIINHEDSSN